MGEVEEGATAGESLQTMAFIVLLVVTGIAAWSLQSRPELTVDSTPLEGFPTRIGIWRSVDIPIEPAVETALEADLNLQREYRTTTGDAVWLYVGYYGTELGGRPEHTPRFCYPAAGWGIEASRVLSSDRDDGLRVNEYVVRRDDHSRLVHFWYRSHRQTGLLGGLDQNLDRLVGRLWAGRADGALVRISTPIVDDDEVTARSRLLSLGGEVDQALAEHWPIERAVDAVQPIDSASSRDGIEKRGLH